MTRRGGAGKGSGSKGRGGAEHGQACTKERTGAVASAVSAVRAALESAVQVGRGDELGMQVHTRSSLGRIRTLQNGERPAGLQVHRDAPLLSRARCSMAVTGSQYRGRIFLKHELCTGTFDVSRIAGCRVAYARTSS
jgi:hypothetical protein